MSEMRVVGKPQDAGSGGDGGVDVVAAVVLLLVVVLVVAPMVVSAWRKGNRATAAIILAAPLASIGLWLLAVALTN